MPTMAVADTHALLWYAQGRQQKLGSAARKMFADADEGRAVIFVPTLSLAEVSEAMRAGKMRLGSGFAAWVRGLLATQNFIVADLTWDVIRKAEELYAIPERGDRLIAATAAHMELPLISRDPEIEAAAGVRVIW
ncbi:MAG TPA: type II toxin-antitoxin system VapC family toxin [Longimicrobiaceae bacterium]|jgi:PIN domain nuclease of toxin-antitoxin system|nr:type II toxin-antitoxin system VapC family toxin [Longimicrobiaceae bacterium]